MDAGQDAFPPRARLWRGAILGTIAHAIWIAHDPLLSAEQSWDGPNYSLQDTMGSQGTVTFMGDRVVGVFFDAHSPRNPFPSGKEYDWHPLLAGISSDLLALAERGALQYVLQEYKGTILPVITAAFWSDGECLAAVEPWHEAVRHGAHLVRIQVMETEAAITAWQEHYGLSVAQSALLRSLYHRKMAASSAPVVLEQRERDILTAGGVAGLAQSRDLLAAIDIVVP